MKTETFKIVFKWKGDKQRSMKIETFKPVFKWKGDKQRNYVIHLIRSLIGWEIGLKKIETKKLVEQQALNPKITKTKPKPIAMESTGAKGC